MALLEKLLSHPIFWGVLALVAISIALSGRLSVSAAGWVMWAAWALAVFGAYRAAVTFNLDPLLTLLVAGTCACLFAIGAVVVNRWYGMDPKASNIPRAPSAEEKNNTPSLSVALVVDAVDKQFVEFHFLLENSGPGDISVSHLLYSSYGETATEGNMSPNREIAPHAGLTSNGFLFRKDLPGDLSVSAVYSANGDNTPIRVTYGFAVRSIDLRPHTIVSPSSREQVIGGEIDTKTAIDQGFNKVAGTITFWFPEKVQDNAAGVYFEFPRTKIIYDSLNRRIFLAIVRNGPVVRKSAPLREGKHGQHFVAVTWDDAAGAVQLYVDGVGAPSSTVQN